MSEATDKKIKTQTGITDIYEAFIRRIDEECAGAAFGKTGTESGISAEPGPGYSAAEHLDGNGIRVMPIQVFCKNTSQKAAIETLFKICDSLEAEGDKLHSSVISVKTASYPSLTDSAPGRTYIYSAVIEIKYYLDRR